MTCIVGMLKGKKIYMGADAAGVAGLDMTVRADEKVFIRNKKGILSAIKEILDHMDQWEKRK